MWLDTACILFTCVTANHLGLVSAVERTLNMTLPVINCCKCFTFWAVLLFWLADSQPVVVSCAVSFLSAYIAVWLELAEACIDTLFDKAYEKMYGTEDNDTPATTAVAGDTDK